MTEEQVRALFNDTNAEEEAIQELTTALRNLNAWTGRSSCDEFLNNHISFYSKFIRIIIWKEKKLSASLWWISH